MVLALRLLESKLDLGLIVIIVLVQSESLVELAPLALLLPDEPQMDLVREHVLVQGFERFPVQLVYFLFPLELHNWNNCFRFLLIGLHNFYKTYLIPLFILLIFIIPHFF